MAAWKQTALVVLGGIVAVVGGCAFLLHSLAKDMCGNEILSELPSPDRNLKAITFQRDCGATTGFSTQLSVLKSSETLPNEPGNIVAADNDDGKAPSGVGGGPELRVSWVGTRNLRISHHRDARIYIKEGAEGVRAEYAPFE